MYNRGNYFTLKTCDLHRQSIIDFGQIHHYGAEMTLVDGISIVAGTSTLQSVMPLRRELVSCFYLHRREHATVWRRFQESALR
jgi:hypothetical protein